jgi:hypothetical protein
MNFSSKLTLGIATCALFGAFFVTPRAVFAQDHVVSTNDLKQDVALAAQLRQSHIANIEKMLSSEQGQRALKSANIDYKVVQSGISTLSDDELARLSARADQAQKDFAAGALTNEQITYIIIALATAVIILVIVH